MALVPSNRPNRAKRVADLIQQDLMQILRKESNDPRFANLTITTVHLARDFSLARIFVIFPEGEQIKETIIALNKAAGFFRRFLASALNLRITPRLEFTYDESVARGQRISAIIDAAIKSDEEKHR